jgi:hypothetical protein
MTIYGLGGIKMRKMIVKILSILCGVLMLLILFTGCGKSKINITTSNKSNKTNASNVSLSITNKSASSRKTTLNSGTANEITNNEDKFSDSAEEGQVVQDGEEPGSIDELMIDLNGRVLKVASFMPQSVPTAGRSLQDDYWLKSIENAEKIYNVKFQFEVTAATGLIFTNKFMESELAGVYYADALFTQSYLSIPALTSKNLIIPIDDYIDFNKPVWGKGGSLTLWAGKHYGIPFSKGNGMPGQFVNYSRNFFETQALPDPLDLADANKWNWDTFLDIAIKSTIDINGDGFTDKWGIVTNNAYITEAMIISNNAFFLRTESDGSVYFNLDNTNAIKALQFTADLFNIYKVAKVVANTKNMEFQSGNAAMWVGPYFMNVNFCRNTGMGSVGAAPLPLGPDVDTFQNHATVTTFLAFPASTEDPQNVLQVFEYYATIWDPSKPEHMTDEEADANLQNAFDTPRDLQWVKRLMNLGSQYDFYNGFTNYYNLISRELITPIAQGKMSVGNALDAIRAPAQAAIDGYLK